MSSGFLDGQVVADMAAESAGWRRRWIQSFKRYTWSDGTYLTVYVFSATIQYTE
jgi:hypothetical protein